MTYKKLKDGSYCVGYRVDRQFIAYASAFDRREAKALVDAIRAVIDLFHKTSGAWVTMNGVVEIPRGSTKKREAREKQQPKQPRLLTPSGRQKIR